MNTLSTFMISRTLIRILISYALFSQVMYMLYYNSKKVLASSFYIFSVGTFLMAYKYYLDDNNKMTSRTYFKSINAIMIFIIGYLAMK